MIVIAGLPGSGWETIAQTVADRWAVGCVNTDDAVCARAETDTISNAYLQLGENAFRDLERDVLREALASDAGVVCAGSGVIENPESAHLLQGITGVFCDVDVPTALRRLGLRASVTAGINPRATWVRLAAARRDAYTAWAAHTVNTSHDNTQGGTTPAPITLSVSDSNAPHADDAADTTSSETRHSSNSGSCGTSHSDGQPSPVADVGVDEPILRAVDYVTQHLRLVP